MKDQQDFLKIMNMLHRQVNKDCGSKQESSAR
jgi:hypothetical protein